MTVNTKVRFIHFRNTVNVQTATKGEVVTVPLAKGGATVAWKFDESGDILVGAPAVCSPEDHFFKSAGRQIAEYNLNNPTDKTPLAFVVPKAQYMEILKSEVQSFQSMQFLSKSFRDKVTAMGADMVADDPFSFVNLSWFEQKIRQTVAFHENRVYTANGKVYGRQGQ